MDYRTMFSNYPNIHEFLSQNPGMDVDMLVSLLKPMQYALKLNGKVLSDIEQNASLIEIYFFASALEVKHYKAMTRSTLLPVINEKYNNAFLPLIEQADNQDALMELGEETKEEDSVQEEEKVQESEESEADALPLSTETETTETNDDVTKKRKREEQEAGFVYVFSNPMYSYYGENVYKIGYSKDPEKRVHDFDTGYPEETTIVYTYHHERARNLEQSVHKALDIFRLFPNREFFKCSITTIRDFVECLGNKV